MAGLTYHMIVGASDRKYTVGDWTYEPSQTKQYVFSHDAVALIAGDASENLAICHDVSRRLVEAPTTVIREIAEMYADAFADYRRREAERWVLRPIGLTLATYGAESPERVERLEELLRRWKLEDAAIVTGCDSTGAHIFRVDDPGWATFLDSVAFTAIGSGANHAGAEFMRVGYERSWSVARALLLAYRAKKAAEVDPFVGKATDMFVISLGGTAPPGLSDVLFNEIEKIHAEVIEQNDAARQKADERIEHYVEEFLTEYEEQTLEPKRDEGPIDEEGLHGGSEEGEPES